MELHTDKNALACQSAIARLAGVAQSTVSMALNADPRIAADTRKRIAAIAAQLDYHPDLNLAARRMAQRRTGRSQPFNTVGFVWHADYWMSHPTSFSQLMLNGIMRGCQETDQSLLLINLEWNLKANRAKSLASLSELGGLIMQAHSPALIQAAQQMKKPFIILMSEPRDFASVWIDDGEAVRVAFRHLRENGHSRIGYIGPAMADPATTKRYESYLACMRADGLAPDPACMITESEFSFQEQGEKNLRELWSGGGRPSAVIVHNDLMALGALQAADALGVKVPDDLSMVSIDDVAEAATSRPPLTTVAIDIEGMGRRAVTRLHEFSRSGNYFADHIRMPLELKRRGSVKSVV